MTDKSQNPKNNRNSLLIVVVIVLALTNLLQWYFNKKSDEKNKEVLENKEMELVATFVKLDSISKQLDDKIMEIKRLNGNVDSLMVIKEQLEKEKMELKTAKTISQDRYNSIKDKVESYEMLLKRKDQEIVKLKQVNEELLSETITLKEEKVALKDEISNLRVERGALTEKITAAATLRAINIKFFQINKRDKETEGTEFKASKLAKLKILFNIDENAVAQVGTRRILLRIIEPEGSALYNVGAGSGSFNYKGSELFYTLAKEILFDNSQQLVDFEYDKGSEFKKGQYQIEIYCDGAVIGKSLFIVK